MSDRRRIEVGFGGGQVVSLNTTLDEIEKLHKALEADSDSWYRIDTDDGSIVLDLPEVVFVREISLGSTVGFAG